MVSGHSLEREGLQTEKGTNYYDDMASWPLDRLQLGLENLMFHPSGQGFRWKQGTCLRLLCFS